MVGLLLSSKISIGAKAVTVRVAEVSFPGAKEGVVMRHVGRVNDQVGNTCGNVLLHNVLDRQFAGWNDKGDGAVVLRVDNGLSHDDGLAEYLKHDCW